ncbi:hypothetical protein [Pseudomonas asiatica]
MNHPTFEEFACAINKNSESAELNLVFSKIGITVQNLHDYKLDVPGQRLWSDDAAALQLEFKDVGILNEIPYHDIDEGPWVLTDVIFWGWQRETNSYYTGPLPYELNFQLNRDSIRDKLLKKLGKPSVYGISDNVDVWTLETIEMAIDYDGEKGIRCISLGLPPD